MVARSVQRLAAVIGALVLAAGVAVTGPAGPAQAATCVAKASDTVIIHMTNNPATVTFWFAPECSDGTSRMWGTLYDKLCDGRAAQFRYDIYDRRSDGSYVRESGPWTKSTSNGCGTSITFNDVRASPGSLGWRLNIRLIACNSWGSCSSYTSLAYYG